MGQIFCSTLDSATFRRFPMDEAKQSLGSLHVLILASLREHTGNSVTASRLAAGIGAARCSCIDVSAFADADALRRHIQDDGVGMVLGIHAYRSGRLVAGCGVPYAIVLGGTDMNEQMKQPDKRAVMEAALQGAGAIVAFTQELLTTLLIALPSIRSKAHLVPQAIRTCVPARSLAADLAGDGTPSRTEEEAAVLEQLDVRSGERLFLLPAGLRPVKDVLFAAAAVAEWHSRGSNAVIRIVGPELDGAYTESVRRALAALEPPRAVTWAGALPQRGLHLAMRAACAVLNTSASEGMCNSILEAFALGTPVLARRNTGNAALVADGETGLLFDTPEELVARAQQLLSESELRGRLAARALALVALEHSASKEAKEYTTILQGILL